MKGTPLRPGAEDITWRHQVALWGLKASSTRNPKPQNLKTSGVVAPFLVAFILFSSRCPISVYSATVLGYTWR